MTDLEFTIPFGDWVQAFVDWLVVAASGLFDVITFVFRSLYELLYTVLSWPPNWLFIIGVAVLALFARGWRLAVGAIVGLAFIISVCSNVDAIFILPFASTFLPGSIVAFLVFGPIIDIKMLALMRTTYAARALVQWHRSNAPHARLDAVAAVENVVSQRVLEKVGFTPTGPTTNHGMACVLYALPQLPTPGP